VADFVVLHQLVDRVLQQQKARRQATEKAKLEETEKAEREEAEKVRSETSALFISNIPEMTLYYTDEDSNHANEYPVTPSRYGDSKLVITGNSRNYRC
jgi:hypothetical protein